MKKAKHTTPYLLIRAGNSHPMDHVDYAIIFYSEAWCKTMLRRYHEVLPLLKDESFATVRYRETPLGFFCSEDEFDLAGILEHNQDWTFIELEEGEPDSLDKRNGGLSESFICINDDGNAYYAADDGIDQYETFPFNIPIVCNPTF